MILKINKEAFSLPGPSRGINLKVKLTPQYERNLILMISLSHWFQTEASESHLISQLLSSMNQ